MSEKIYYKGFDKNFQCRGFQYEVHKSYTHKGKIEPCESGFHACEYPLSVFNYYAPAYSRFAEVEASGEIVLSGDKIACEKLKIKSELSLDSLIKAAIKFTFDSAKWSKEKIATGNYGAASATGEFGAASATGERGAASATGERGAASATGFYGAASAMGYRGAASATGNQGAASATGFCGAASATGNYGAASATGFCSAASATGYQGAASATGYRGAASATGNYGAASATGEFGAASATGNQGAASATGNYGAASATGKDSIACGLGYKCKAKGAKGCWLVLAERDEDGKILTVKTACVDGKKIKENVFYVLEKGKFKEFK